MASNSLPVRFARRVDVPVCDALVATFQAYVRSVGLPLASVGDAQECMTDARFTREQQRWMGAFVALWDCTVGTPHDADAYTRMPGEPFGNGDDDCPF